MKKRYTATAFAVLAAALYAVNIPLSKTLLLHVSPTMMAAFLYLGAGLGLIIFRIFSGGKKETEHLTRKELPYTLGMILLDIAAPILLMIGLEQTNSANASLLNNFEIVATSVIAYFIFREKMTGKLAAAIFLVTLASAALSFEGQGSLEFQSGSLYVLGAACCWGLENNCTRMLSSKDSVEITTIKGICSGLGSLGIAFLVGERLPGIIWIPAVLLLGFISYGLSINFYIKAQKDLGAAKTSAYYSLAPFLGAGLGMVFLKEQPDLQFYLGLVIMAAAMLLMMNDTLKMQNTES